MKRLLVAAAAFAAFEVSATTFVLDVAEDRETTAAENEAIAALTADDTLQKTGAGLVRYTERFVFAGTLQLDEGVFAISNAANTDIAATLKGTGAFRQEAGELRLTKDQSKTFDGDFEVYGGTNSVLEVPSTVTVFGSTKGMLVVNGGLLRLYSRERQNAMNFGVKPVHLCGAGPDGTGVYKSDQYSNTMFYNLVLDGDTTVGGWLGPSGWAQPYLNFGKAGSLNYSLDMQGHTLTVTNIAHFTFNQNAVIANCGRIVQYGGALNAYAGADLGTSGTYTFKSDKATFNAYHAAPVNRPIEIDMAASDRYLNVLPIYDNQEDIVLNGDVTFSASNLGYLYLSSRKTNSTHVVNGWISGPGKVSAYFTAPCGTVRLMNPTNAFTGGVTVSTDNSGKLFLAHPGSASDYSKVTVKHSVLAVDGTNWESSNVVALARQVTVNAALRSGGNLIAVNTDGCEGDTATLTLGEDDVTATMARIGHDGPGTLVIDGNFSNPLQLGFAGGVTRLMGEKITLGSGRWMQTEEPYAGFPEPWAMPSKVVIDGAKDVHLVSGKTSADGTLGIGYYNATHAPGCTKPMRVEIRNSTVHDDYYYRSSTDHAATYNTAPVYLGYSAPATLTVGEGADVTTAMVVGYRDSNAGKSGAGAVYQDGGKMALAYNNAWTARWWIGYTAYGYYELTGGVCVEPSMGGSSQLCGAANTAGIFTQTGGAFTNSNFQVGASVNGYGEMNFRGGVAKTVLNLIRGDSGIRDCTAVLNIDGGEVEGSLATCNGASNNVSIINFLGGRYSVGTICKTSAAAAWRRPEWSSAYVNFNGGTLRATSDIFHTNDLRRVDRVTVFAGGAVIEVPANATRKVQAPLEAPAGKGVASIPLPAAVSSGIFVGPPGVKIVGAGCGATAVTVFDRATGRVTGVRVLTPGCGYDAGAKAQFLYNDILAEVDCALTGETPASGGLVKTGKGTLKLDVPNTFTGPVVVEEGTLDLACADALTAESLGQVVYRGGVMTATSGVALPPVELALTVGETVSYADAVTFPEGSVVTVANLAAVVEEESPYVLATFAKGFTGSLDVATSAPDGWKIRVTPKAVKLSRYKGTMLFIR